MPLYGSYQTWAGRIGEALPKPDILSGWGAKKPSNVKIKNWKDMRFLLDFPRLSSMLFGLRHQEKLRTIQTLPTFSLKSRKVEQILIFLNFKLKSGSVRIVLDCPQFHSKIYRSARFSHPDPILSQPNQIFVGILSALGIPTHGWQSLPSRALSCHYFINSNQLHGNVKHVNPLEYIYCTSNSMLLGPATWFNSQTGSSMLKQAWLLTLNSHRGQFSNVLVCLNS